MVQSGELGSADTMHRLQTTHWLWTSEPQVFANEYPEFGLHGRNGTIYSWYGIGQSLLMLPGDLLGTWLAHFPIFKGYEDDPAVRSIVVTYLTNILINILTALIAFHFLRQLRFSIKQAVAGVIALLFCTTHLHYTQNMMENNYIMLLTLVGFSFQYEWLRSGSRGALVIGSAALGLNLLTRVTTGLDLIAAGVFLLLILMFEGSSRQTLWQRFLAYCTIAAPIYCLLSCIERYYNYYRFGSFTSTYIPIFARELRERDPSLPANFPWSTPFAEGFFGALFKPEKSIFLFDPLLVLAIVLLAILWKRLAAEVRAYAVASLLIAACLSQLLCEVCILGRGLCLGRSLCFDIGGISGLLGVPLLLHYRPQLGGWAWRCGIAIVAGSFVIQIASLAFWLPLEIYQMETLGHPTFVIALRFKNILAFALGKMDAWGLNTPAMSEDQWDYVHITTWNFLPFLLRRVGAAPEWVVKITFALWFAAVAALAWVLSRLGRAVRSSELSQR